MAEDCANNIETLIKKEDINIHIEKGLLTIQHEHKTEVTTNSTNKYIRKEFSVKSFKRTFSIDDKIDEGIEFDKFNYNTNCTSYTYQVGSNGIDITCNLD